ncbi:MAG: DUF4293 domain-containing protein [Tannerellaceae bacterium]|jgi:hypothetical protein|nr:DUF4293 domain-containing protein [Tannerellaceae bacterium]
MLQRIQTVYLLIIAVLAALMLVMPLSVLQIGDTFYTFEAFGVNAVMTTSEIVYPTWGLFVLAALVSLLALFTIFLYKKRMLQIRLCIFNAILMLGFYGFFAYLIVIMKQQLDVSVSVRIALSFPLICLILDYLAIRNIGADETLVRSLERLR